MFINLHFEPYQITQNTHMLCDIEKMKGFPVLTIDKDSYIVKATVSTGLNFRPDDGTYNLQIGKYCSLAEDIYPELFTEQYLN